ncbi:hypothetical protein ACP4OV_020419 [Aristida adscensionis]
MGSRPIPSRFHTNCAAPPPSDASLPIDLDRPNRAARPEPLAVGPTTSLSVFYPPSLPAPAVLSLTVPSTPHSRRARDTRAAAAARRRPASPPSAPALRMHVLPGRRRAPDGRHPALRAEGRQRAAAGGADRDARVRAGRRRRRPSALPSLSRRSPAWPRQSPEIGDLGTVVASSDDNTLKPHAEAEALGRQGKDDVWTEKQDEVDKDLEPLGWLPDGWIMEVRHDSSGFIHRYYISPLSGKTFSTEKETLDYLFSRMEDHLLDPQACINNNELHRMHTWLPDGWVMEIRAGGKKMEKMYKFYVHLPTGKRCLSKGEVLGCDNEDTVSRCDMDAMCDTSSDDNILAQVDFNPDGLPNGWVKQTIFRKCNDGTRKDPYYTDPISHRVFRTLKSVLSYLETGEISKHAYIPKKSVTDMYSFDKCADMGIRDIQFSLQNEHLWPFYFHTSNILGHYYTPQSMQKRLKVEGLDKKLLNGPTSDHSEGGTSDGITPQCDPKVDKLRTVKASTEKEISSDINQRPRGRPKKIMTQTDESTPRCAKSPDNKETKHVAVKIELDIGDREHMPNEKALESTEKKHDTVMQEVDSNSNLTESELPMRKPDNMESVTEPIVHEQEKGKLAESGQKLTYSTVSKFYMRRSNQTPGSKKDKAGQC